MTSAAPQKPGIGRSVVLPSVLFGAAYGVLGLFLSTFLRDIRSISFGLVAGWIIFTTGRVLAHFDIPKGRGLFLRHVLTGTALGFGGVAFLNGLFKQGPGWPWTPWWVLLAGFGFGLFRAHKVLLSQARDAPGKRVLGLFHPKDLEALSVLVLGWGLLGLAGFLIFRAFSGFIPGAGKLLTIGIALYALQGARYLLTFAGEERASSGAGALAWLKANALQIAIVVILLVAYAAFRDQLSQSVPFFPLVEFGLGMAVFGFVLARLRARMRRDGTALATASTARDHERVVTELREADYDSVARPVTRFIESGLGRDEYAEVLAQGASNLADQIRARIAAYREPPRAPVLDREWGFLAGAAMTLGLTIAAIVLGVKLFHAEWPYPLYLGLIFVGFGTYAQQDVARGHQLHWGAVAIAAAGTGVLLLDLALFLGSVGALTHLPTIVWAIIAGIVGLMVGVPALNAWRAQKRLASGELIPDARRVSPSLEITNEIQRTRKRAATMTTVAFVLLLPVPWLADWLAGRHIIPAGFPTFLRDLLAIVIWVIAGFGGAALIRFYGLTRGRPGVLAREKAKRDRRLQLHRELIDSIEQV